MFSQFYFGFPDGKRVNRIQAQVFPGVKLPDSEDEASFFSAFVDYIISEGPYKYNLHFRPYWFRCDVCEIAVKYIGKLETNWEDKEFILKKFGLPIENGKHTA